MVKILSTRQSRQDLSDVHDLIAEHSPTRAKTWVQNVRQKYQNQLSIFPKAGVAHEELGDGIRLLNLPDQRAIVAYVVTEKMVIIKRIFYAGIDYENRLKH